MGCKLKESLLLVIHYSYSKLIIAIQVSLFLSYIVATWNAAIVNKRNATILNISYVAIHIYTLSCSYTV